MKNENNEMCSRCGVPLDVLRELISSGDLDSVARKRYAFIKEREDNLENFWRQLENFRDQLIQNISIPM